MFGVKNENFVKCEIIEDIYEISTTYEDKTELVCKTNLECVAKIICQLFDVNYKRLNGNLDDLCQFIFSYVIRVMTYREVKGIYIEFPHLAQYNGTALIAPSTVIDTRNEGKNNPYFLILINIIYDSLIHTTVKPAGSNKEAAVMKETFDRLLPENKGLLDTLNDYYDGYINENDLGEIVKNIRMNVDKN